MRIIVIVSRILVGALLIFSGFIKANDPLGFTYKLEEYFQVFNTPFFTPLALYLAIVICAAEIILGFMILIGSRIKIALWLTTLMMLFFTFLTFYSAYYNKVTDCGCFGDFLKLTPWQSFYKDVALMVLLLILIFGHKYLNRLLPFITENIVLVLIACSSIAFPIYTLMYHPIFDFRPYKAGTNLLEAMSIPEGASQGKYETRLYYENLKSGESKEFTLQNYPWQDTLNWKYDTTITVVLEEPYLPPVHDFNLIDESGNDLTDSLLKLKGDKIFIVCYDLNKTSAYNIAKLNDFVALCLKNKLLVYGITASSERAASFAKEQNWIFQFLIADATQLKTMVRSNPGIVWLKESVVKNMWSVRSLPPFSEVFNNK